MVEKMSDSPLYKPVVSDSSRSISLSGFAFESGIDRIGRNHSSYLRCSNSSNRRRLLHRRRRRRRRVRGRRGGGGGGGGRFDDDDVSGNKTLFQFVIFLDRISRI